MAVLTVFAPIRIAFIALLLCACATAQAQRDDWHLQSRDLFIKSAFAHGYMHGYEQGFHNGDIDLQMGRDYREVKHQTEYKKPTGYRDQFGDRTLFEAGYRSGFLVGYTDCFAGRNFRAAQLLNLGQTTQYPGGSVALDHNFDRAFRDGYESGQMQGLADGRASEVSRHDPSTCKVEGGHDKAPPQYCDGFRDGYQLGYSDGFANQRQSGDIFARNNR
jgi:hypothetical protein